MFDKMKPCGNCPFRVGRGALFRLSASRLTEIRAASAFQCHKTVDYGADRPSDRAGVRPQQCAGLMAVLAREAAPNQIMQVAQRMGVLDAARLDPEAAAYKSWADAERAHINGIEPETCEAT